MDGGSNFDYGKWLDELMSGVPGWVEAWQEFEAWHDTLYPFGTDTF